MALHLGKTVIDYLKGKPGQRFTARQIAEWVFDAFPAECQTKKAASKSGLINTDDDLKQQLVAEIGAQRLVLQKQCPQLKTTEGRPREYYYSEKPDDGDDDAASAEPTPDEKALYPLLTQYLFAEFGMYSMRIDEKRSSNKQGRDGNHWLHPDVVGMGDLGAGWDREVRDCVREYFDKRTKLWSFEVKKKITRGDVRKCFFQAVSNSSWANFGYLVATEVADQATTTELRMLCAAHGIGFITLNAKDPASSELTIPAHERDEIDWNMVNRLASVNKDFMNYVKLVRKFYQTGEADPKDWDAVPTPED